MFSRGVLRISGSLTYRKPIVPISSRYFNNCSDSALQKLLHLWKVPGRSLAHTKMERVDMIKEYLKKAPYSVFDEFDVDVAEGKFKEEDEEKLIANVQEELDKQIADGSRSKRDNPKDKMDIKAPCLIGIEEF
jgi:hypothetical protein